MASNTHTHSNNNNNNYTNNNTNTHKNIAERTLGRTATLLRAQHCFELRMGEFRASRGALPGSKRVWRRVSACCSSASISSACQTQTDPCHDVRQTARRSMAANGGNRGSGGHRVATSAWYARKYSSTSSSGTCR
eukprot:2765197-Rhodomonas_salina.1